MVDKCSELAITAATASADCENDNRSKDGEALKQDGSNKCKFTAAIVGKCMKNGAEVDKKKKNALRLVKVGKESRPQNVNKMLASQFYK